MAAPPWAAGLVRGVVSSGFSILAWAGGALSAEQAGGPQWSEGLPTVTAAMITEHVSIQPGGRTRIGVHFEMAEGWHIYAEDPGDAGLPTAIAWSSPAGVSVGALQWPSAEEFVDPGDIRTYGYAGAVVLSSPVTLAPRWPGGGSVPIRAAVTWLACKQICIPGSLELELALPVSAQPGPLSANAELFDQIDEQDARQPR